MNIQQDFSGFLRLSGIDDVDYMVAGGYAGADYGDPRFTRDLDVFYSNSIENTECPKRALTEFGFPPDDRKEDLFSEASTMIQFGAPPCRMDWLSQISGLSFAGSTGKTVLARYGDVEKE